MSETFGSINFGNIPVAVGGGGSVTGADEGLILDSGNVQLGGPVGSPGLVTVPRSIEFDPGAALLLGELATGNNVNFEIDTGLTVDTRDFVSGRSQRVEFAFDGFKLHNSGVTAFEIYDSYPGGALVSQFGTDGIVLPYTTYIRNASPTGNMGLINEDLSGQIDVLIGVNKIASFFDENLFGIGGNAMQLTKGAIGAVVLYDVDFYTGVNSVTGNFEIFDINANAALLKGKDQLLEVEFSTGLVASFVGPSGAGLNRFQIESDGVTGAEILFNGITPFSVYYDLGSDSLYLGPALSGLNIANDGTVYISPNGVSFNGTDKWTFGAPVAAAVAFDSANYLTITVNGVSYKLALAI